MNCVPHLFPPWASGDEAAALVAAAVAEGAVTTRAVAAEASLTNTARGGVAATAMTPPEARAAESLGAGVGKLAGALRRS